MVAGFRMREIKVPHLCIQVLKAIEDEGEYGITRSNGQGVVKLPVKPGKLYGVIIKGRSILKKMGNKVWIALNSQPGISRGHKNPYKKKIRDKV